MTAAPNADRMTANRITRERDMLAREAAELAQMAARFAEKPQRGINIGSPQHIAEMARRLELRALKVQTLAETAELYAADLAEKEAS